MQNVYGTKQYNMKSFQYITTNISEHKIIIAGKH